MRADSTVEVLYWEKIHAYFAFHGVQTHVVTLLGEESNKRLDAVDTILEQCCAFGLRRREPIIAIGGGVILDIVGMAANMYRRGVPFIRVPTTLLAIVDASVVCSKICQRLYCFLLRVCAGCEERC
jgi:3-dehydroquinate synthase